MGKGAGDVLINKINVLLPKVIPPLLLGYVIWDHTLVAEIYHTLYLYLVHTLQRIFLESTSRSPFLKVS